MTARCPCVNHQPAHSQRACASETGGVNTPCDLKINQKFGIFYGIEIIQYDITMSLSKMNAGLVTKRCILH